MGIRIGGKRLDLGRAVVVWVLIAIGIGASGQRVKDRKDELDDISFSKPSLRIVESVADSQAMRGPSATAFAANAFIAGYGPAWRVLMDERRDRPALLDGGAIPFLPGAANKLDWKLYGSSCPRPACVSIERAESEARAFLARNKSLFGLEAEEIALDAAGSGPFGDGLYFMRFQQVYAGLPVEGASVYFRINNGNLIQVATERVGRVSIDPAPSITVKSAQEILNAFLGTAAAGADIMLDSGSLLIVPVTPQGGDPNFFQGAIGSGLSHALVYRFAFKRKGVTGTWQAYVDAHTGEILQFGDANRYGKVVGGIYPVSQYDTQVSRPLPYADYLPGQYADAAGNFSYPGGTVTSTLSGRYVTVVDNGCSGATQAISLSSSVGPGDLDFKIGDVTTDDSNAGCVTPSPSGYGGMGNTHASRTGYYHLNLIKMKALTYLPSNAWLLGQLTDNVNINDVCNAYWDGTSVNFFKQGWYFGWHCANTGELAGVFLHEWGHGMDDNDGSGGNSPPVETRADWTAILQTHDSCAGTGFFLGTACDGYGDACSSCDGIREADWNKHSSKVPWTPANNGQVSPGFSCSGGSYNGPCGWEDHCESGIATQALWDFVTRDLVGPPTSMDITSAWQLADRLFYLGMPTLGNMYTCTAPTSDGCGGGSLYTVMRALDDDGDGTANGTPHAAAIFAALNRHNIACGTAGGAQNQNQTSCPALTTPVLSATAGDSSVALSWSSGGSNAVKYVIYRNEFGCDAGFTKIGEVAAPAVAFTDTLAANKITYYYRVQAQSANASCLSPMSGCASGTPLPYAGLISFSASPYKCDAVAGITVEDADLMGGGSQEVTVTSTLGDSEPLTLLETPPGSGIMTGSITLTSAAAVPGNGVLSVANGATITGTYIDADDHVGGINVPRTANASIDCVAPVISGVTVLSFGARWATITWQTGEAADSRVTYGPSAPPAISASKSGFRLSHTMTLTGLTPCTNYYFSVSGSDAAGNIGSDNNGGAYYLFSTLGDAIVAPAPVSSDVPKTINDFKTAISTLEVLDARVLSDVNVTINITHTADQDLRIRVRHPDGTAVTLSQNNGMLGNNYTNTTFDDQAETIIWMGSPPFTGTFKPETPLSILNGKPANGTWTLEVYDGSLADVGSLDSWSMQLTVDAPCGADLRYQSSLASDTCHGTGGGSGNGVVDPGEDIVLPVTLVNQGLLAVSGVSATLSTTTPGVTIQDATATFPDIQGSGTATCLSPSFVFSAAPSMACGAQIDFNLHIDSSQGSSDSPFALRVGQQSTTNILSEDFEGPLRPPLGWATQVFSGNAWAVGPLTYPCAGTYHLRYYYMTAQDADSWAYTRSLALQAGVTYTLSFKQRVGGAAYPEKLSVYLGTSQDSAAMTSLLWQDLNLTNETCQIRTPSFTVPSNGTYFIGFHATSVKNMYAIGIDDVSLTSSVCLSSSCAASTPNEVTGLKWATGSKSSMTWNANAQSAGYKIYRGVPSALPALLNATNDSCLRWSGAGTVSDSVLTEVPPAGSFYWYLATGVNSGGEGTAGNASAGARVLNSTGPCP